MPLQFVILDFDDVVMPHMEGAHEAIIESIAHTLDLHLSARGIAVPKSTLAKQALDSWFKHRLGTKMAADTHDLDLSRLHRDYHDHFLRTHIRPQFNRLAQDYGAFFDDLRSCLAKAVGQGVGIGILTHGCGQYAARLCEEVGIASFAPIIRGIDSYEFRMKHTHGSLYDDFLRDAGYEGHKARAVLIDDSKLNIDFAVSHGLQGRWVQGETPQARAKNTLHVLRCLTM